MLNNESFAVQSLSSNLFYLRTIREFCLNIQLSFYQNNQFYIKQAEEIGEECERVGRMLVPYIGLILNEETRESRIYVTPYTLPLEKLTEKLFDVTIATDITEQELNNQIGRIPIIDETLVKNIEEINGEVLKIVDRFIKFNEDIISKLESQNLFSYSYISFYRLMVKEIKLYKRDLERLMLKDPKDPIFVIDYEYWYIDVMRDIARFMKGLVDPEYEYVDARATAFMLDFTALRHDYATSTLSPDTEKELENKALDLLSRFSKFIEEVIQKLLNKELYFIVEPIFLDNIYTEVNYAYYLFKQTKNQN